MRLTSGIVAAVLLAACSSGSKGQDDNRPPLDPATARRSLEAAPVYSACGTPVVDGVISPGEWDHAVSVRFAAQVPESSGGGEIPGTLQVLSDDVNVYLAVHFDLPTTGWDQSIGLDLDADRSGDYSRGDDAFVVSRGFVRGAPELVEYMVGDDYFWPCVVDGQPALCAPSDDQLPDVLVDPPARSGTVDGGGVFGVDSASTTMELWHPYHGTDPLDLFLEPGDTLGLRMSVRLLDACPDSEWQRCVADTSYPEFNQFRTLVVGCGAPPAEEIVTVRLDIKPGDALPTIHLSSGGTTSAAVLGGPDFDAATVDPETAYLAGAPVARKPDGTAQASLEDVNGDGFVDMVLHFQTSALQLTADSTTASVAGKTTSGREFRGTDVVRVLP